MFADYNDFGRSPLRKVRLSLTNLSKVAAQPIKKLVTDPKSTLDLKAQWKMGTAIGKSAEKVVVSANPLDNALRKFDEKGIKAGGLGRFLGKLGERARTKPIATTAIVYAAVIAAGQAVAAYGTTGTTTTASTTGTAAAGSAGSASTYTTAATTILPKLIGGRTKTAESEQGPADYQITDAGYSNKANSNIPKEASALEKIIATVGPAGLLLLLL